MFDSKIKAITDYVIDNGYLTDSNTFKYGGLEVFTDDESLGIVWGIRLNVFQVDNEEPTYVFGDEDELMIVYCGVINCLADEESMNATNSERTSM